MSAELNSLIKRPLWFYIKKNKRAFCLGLFFLVITNSLDAVYPLFIKEAIDVLTEGRPKLDFAWACIGFLVVMSILAITRFLWRVYFGRYHTEAAEDLRNKIFSHYLGLGPNFFQKNPIGELMSLIINDVQSFRHAIGSGVLILVDGIVIILLVVPLMISLDPTWTIKTLVLLPAVPFLIWFTMRLIYKNYKVQQDRLSELSGYSQESVSGIRVIKGFAIEKYRLTGYNQLSASYEKAGNRVALVDALFYPVMQFGATSGTVILLFIAADDIFSGSQTIGTLIAFQRYISKMVWPMTALGLGFSQFQKGMASFSRIADLLKQKTDVPDTGTINITHIENIKIENLTYIHPGSQNAVLKNISMEIKKGEKVGLVGKVGSGKSTLLNILTRMYPVQLGKILINDHPIQDIKKASLFNQVAVVPQEPFLFSTSVAENIAFGLTEKSPEEVKEWAQIVDIHQEMLNLPQGYDSQLGERGINLSGGQKQRLTLARGLATQKSLIVLDDTLSAVDHKTEEKIISKLREHREHKQSQIIVSHRLSAILDCDRIYFFNEGEITGVGTHQQLLEACMDYREIAKTQGYL